MELAQVVAAAVRARRPELELLIREQVDAELARLIELVEAELQARRNGAPAEVEEPPPGMRRCRHCGQVKPVAKFPEGRHTCRACKSRRARERQRREHEHEASEEPHPVRQPAGRGLNGPRARRSSTPPRSAASSSPSSGRTAPSGSSATDES